MLRQCTEVRLFGPIWVRRPDGHVVEPSEWRTTKTLDLLRLLALSPGLGRATSAIRLELWPAADETRAQASLRTAVSQLRKVLGADVVERDGASLRLRDVWVDVAAYADTVAEAMLIARQGDHAAAVSLVREAEGWYVDDVEAVEGSEDWLHASAQRLRELRRDGLLEAAESAWALGWLRDAHELAADARRVDPTSERAVRVLMQANAALGEMGQALSAYDELRRSLADRFGVDPAPQTQAVHAQLLRNPPAVPAAHRAWAHPAVGDLARVLSRLRGSGRGQALVWLVGEFGSGRDSVVSGACTELGLSLVNLDGSGVGSHPRSSMERCPDVVVLEKNDWASSLSFHVQAALTDHDRAVVVVPVEPALFHVESLVSGSSGRTEVVRVDPLSREQLHGLARDILRCDPTETLLEVLSSRTGALAGSAAAMLTSWLGSGRIAWTPQGMTLDAAPAPGAVPRSSLHRLRRLSPAAADALAVTAMAEDAVGAEELNQVLEEIHGTTPEIRSRCYAAELVDLGLVRVTPAGLRLAEHARRDEVVQYLRPGRRHQLGRLVAEHIPAQPSGRAPDRVAARVPARIPADGGRTRRVMEPARPA